MNKKAIFTWIIWIIIFSIAFGYSLVFAGTGIFTSPKVWTNIVFKLSNNVYLDSIYLNKTNILFKSDEDLSNYKIKSECSIFSKIKYQNDDYYMFELKFFDNDCSNENFILVSNTNEIKSHFKLKIVREFDVLSKMLDLKTDYLKELNYILEKKISAYNKYSIYNRGIEKNYYTYLEKNRILEETIYTKKILDWILEKRSEKYIVPVLGYNMPKTAIKIPNSGRWYRSDYTDGIHHGWDIDWNFWEKVIALDDWIIVRVISWFDFYDLNAIKKWSNLTENDKVRNLDVLRWNQIWVKTMSWDVVMYSHLNEIFSNIKVWEIVRKWQPLWTIWITGVPDKNYKDFHLHFVVHVNPFNLSKGESYDIYDYMKWDWLFKWESKDYILKNQGKYFWNWNENLSKINLTEVN